MQCGKCGAENDDRAYLCAQCGAALEEVRRSELPAFQGSIPTYLVQAILVTIFCCQPFGIVSIVFAAIATSHLSSGNRAAAIAASNNAKPGVGSPSGAGWPCKSLASFSSSASGGPGCIAFENRPRIPLPQPAGPGPSH